MSACRRSARDLQGDAAELQWVMNAYTAAAHRPAAARRGGGGPVRAADGCWSSASASSPWPRWPAPGARASTWLLAGRAAQGIGAAMLLPNSLAILGARLSGRRRGAGRSGPGRRSGRWPAPVGPVLGGWLIDTVGWRAIFLLNLPIAAGAIALALRFVPRAPRDGQAAAARPRRRGVLATGGPAAP